MRFQGAQTGLNHLKCSRRSIGSPGVDELVCSALILIGAVLWSSVATALSIPLLVIGLILSIWSPVGAFWASCAAIPLVFHPVDIGSASISLLELALIATTAGIGLRVVTERPRFTVVAWTEPKDSRWLWIGAIALLATGALAIVYRPEPEHLGESLRIYRWVIVEAVAAFVAARWALAKRGPDRIACALLIPAVAVSVWSIGQVLFGQTDFEADGVARATGSYLHPNNLALYLGRMFSLVCGALIFTKRDRLPISWLAIALPIALALAATLSRGVLIGVLAGLLALAWYSRRRLALLAVTAAGVALPAAFLVVAQQRFLGTDSSGLAETRMKIWASAVEMIRDYPITGVGLDQFLYHHNPRYIEPAAWSERYISHPHNLVLDSWLSLGLPGLILLGFGLVLLTRRMVGISREWPLEAYWPAAATAAIMTGLVHGLVDNGYFLPDLAVLTWILIALSLGPVSSTLPESAPTR